MSIVLEVVGFCFEVVWVCFSFWGNVVSIVGFIYNGVYSLVFVKGFMVIVFLFFSFDSKFRRLKV